MSNRDECFLLLVFPWVVHEPGLSSEWANLYIFVCGNLSLISIYQADSQFFVIS